MSLSYIFNYLPSNKILVRNLRDDSTRLLNPSEVSGFFINEVKFR